MKVSRFDSTRATNLCNRNCTLVSWWWWLPCVLRLHVVGDLHDLDQLHLGHNQTSVKKSKQCALAQQLTKQAEHPQNDTDRQEDIFLRATEATHRTIINQSWCAATLKQPTLRRSSISRSPFPGVFECKQGERLRRLPWHFYFIASLTRRLWVHVFCVGWML